MEIPPAEEPSRAPSPANTWPRPGVFEQFVMLNSVGGRSTSGSWRYPYGRARLREPLNGKLARELEIGVADLLDSGHSFRKLHAAGMRNLTELTDSGFTWGDLARSNVDLVDVLTAFHGNLESGSLAAALGLTLPRALSAGLRPHAILATRMDRKRLLCAHLGRAAARRHVVDAGLTLDQWRAAGLTLRDFVWLNMTRADLDRMAERCEKEAAWLRGREGAGELRRFAAFLGEGAIGRAGDPRRAQTWEDIYGPGAIGRVLSAR